MSMTVYNVMWIAINDLLLSLERKLFYWISRVTQNSVNTSNDIIHT